MGMLYAHGAAAPVPAFVVNVASGQRKKFERRRRPSNKVDAYMVGIEDYNAGATLKDNPYGSGSKEEKDRRTLWSQGWYDAQSDPRHITWASEAPPNRAA